MRGRDQDKPGEMVPLEDSGEKPKSRKLIFLIRMFELLFTGSAFGLMSYVFTKNHDLGWPPGSTDPGSRTLVFLGLVTILGLVSTLFSIGVACVKYDVNDAMSKNGHSYCGFNMMIVYLGLIYVIISCGAIYSTHKTMGDAGLRCTGSSLTSYQFCSMLMATVVLTGIGAGVAVVSAGIEWRRIRQWGKVLERCQLVSR